MNFSGKAHCQTIVSNDNVRSQRANSEYALNPTEEAINFGKGRVLKSVISHLPFNSMPLWKISFFDPSLPIPMSLVAIPDTLLSSASYNNYSRDTIKFIEFCIPAICRDQSSLTKIISNEQYTQSNVPLDKGYPLRRHMHTPPAANEY